jgi:hypothetical protein
MNNHQSLYLAHHGIMGQKWGKRNGPPYPLAPADHSAAEKKANWRQSLKTNGSEKPKVYGFGVVDAVSYATDAAFKLAKSSLDKSSSKPYQTAPYGRYGVDNGEWKKDEKTNKWSNDDHQQSITDADREFLRKQLKDSKKAGIVAAAIGGALSAGVTAAAAINPEFIPVALMTDLSGLELASLGIAGAVSASKQLRDDKKAVKLAEEYKKERENSPIDDKTGFRVKQNEMSIEDDAKRINPLYKDVTQQSKVNCVLCSVAYDLRRRGYDVTAKGAAIGYMNDEVEPWYNGKIEYKSVESNRYAEIKPDKIVEELKNIGGRGIVNVSWPGGGGHAMAFDNDGGNLKIIDAQSGEIYSDKKLKNAFAHAVGTEYARTDHLTINPKLMLKEVVDQ